MLAVIVSCNWALSGCTDVLDTVHILSANNIEDRQIYPQIIIKLSKEPPIWIHCAESESLLNSIGHETFTSRGSFVSRHVRHEIPRSWWLFSDWSERVTVNPQVVGSLPAETQKTDIPNLHWFELNRPSSKGTKLLLKVIKAIIISTQFEIRPPVWASFISSRMHSDIHSYRKLWLVLFLFPLLSPSIFLLSFFLLLVSAWLVFDLLKTKKLLQLDWRCCHYCIRNSLFHVFEALFTQTSNLFKLEFSVFCLCVCVPVHVLGLCL